MMLTGQVARYVDAWNEHDPVGCGECFAPRGERIWLVFAPSHLGGDPFPRFSGRAEVASAIRDFIRCVPDVRVDVTALSEGSDDRVWTEWRLTGTHLEDWGDWIAAGEPVDLQGVSIFTIGPEGIVLERVYWDMLLMIGLAPALAV
jgi:SnoaL-like domain